MTAVPAATWLGTDGRPLPPLVEAYYAAAGHPIPVAAAFPLHPPGRFFEKPAWLKPGQKMTPVTDGPDAGRVAGYVAPWGTCLLGGDPTKCVKAPSSPSGYAAAMQGETLTAEGATVRTANIGGGINHAPMNPGLFSQKIVDHYANVASQTMRVVYAEDDYGIYACGALWPDVTDLDVAKVRASALSGDWRWRPELAAYDMAGSQLVSVPGYPLILGVSAACPAHPIIVGGMGGVPPDMLEEPMPETAVATPDPSAVGRAVADGVTEGLQAGAPAVAAAGEACSCQTHDAATAATSDVVGVSPETPAQNPAPPTADKTISDEQDQRIADLEAAVAELSDGLRELQTWMADQAASVLDDTEGLPDPTLTAAFGDQKAPPFAKSDGPGPGGPPSATKPAAGPHAFKDTNGDGKCDVCGKPEAGHPAPPA